MIQGLNAKALLEQELPHSVRSMIVPTIRRAYALTDALFSDTEFLRWRVGKDLYRLVRRVVVEHEIKRAVDGKPIGLTSGIASNAIDNCRHLELRSNRLVITVSQVVSPRAVPRRAVYRNQHSISNQQCWVFAGYNDEDGRFDQEKPLYAIITHGYMGKEPQHICIGVPESRIRGWITQIDLLNELRIVPAPEDIEVITEERLVSLRKHVKKVVEDNA